MIKVKVPYAADFMAVENCGDLIERDSKIVAMEN